MAKKKKNKKIPSDRQKFSVESRSTRNKKLALWLLLSMIVFIAVYFSFVRAQIAAIVNVYIWSAFVLSILYVFCAFAVAYMKQKELYKESTEKQLLMQRLDKLRKILLVLFIPMIVTLLIDLMLMNLGIAGYLGI